VQILNTGPEQIQSASLSDDVFDIIIVGAGVVGCAMARNFTLQGAHVAVVEKAADILDGASKANSAILHTGFDAPPGSVELSCIRQGYREYQKIHKKLGLPLENTSAHVVAWSDKEQAKLAAIADQATANGVADIKLISAKELIRAEPNLSTNAKAALLVPGEGIIDPWSAPYAYLRQSLMNGGQVFLNCEVTGGEFGNDRWRLQTSKGSLEAKYIINCAGLYGDRLETILLGNSNYKIVPRKGQFVVFDKAASKLINSIILPVPTSRTKGVVVCKTIFGNVLVGPTAEDQESRSDVSTDEEALKNLIAAGISKIPGLNKIPVTAVYAGLRPATEFKDYQIEARAEKNWIGVGGIRSTGLSSALGIARYVFELYQKLGEKHAPIADPLIPNVPVLAQGEMRDWQRQDHGEIVCHCELVTSREISEALEGPLRACSLSGLKRQTRVTMGRCQGFYCSARLAELTAGHFKTPMVSGFDDG